VIRKFSLAPPGEYHPLRGTCGGTLPFGVNEIVNLILHLSAAKHIRTYSQRGLFFNVVHTNLSIGSEFKGTRKRRLIAKSHSKPVPDQNAWFSHTYGMDMLSFTSLDTPPSPVVC